MNLTCCNRKCQIVEACLETLRYRCDLFYNPSTRKLTTVFKEADEDDLGTETKIECEECYKTFRPHKILIGRDRIHSLFIELLITEDGTAITPWLTEVPFDTVNLIFHKIAIKSGRTDP